MCIVVSDKRKKLNNNYNMLCISGGLIYIHPMVIGSWFAEDMSVVLQSNKKKLKINGKESKKENLNPAENVLWNIQHRKQEGHTNSKIDRILRCQKSIF